MTFQATPPFERQSIIVPEDCRAALYNLFRVPLNVIVLGVLLSDMAVSVAFTWSAGLLLCGAALQAHLVPRLKTRKLAGDKLAGGGRGFEGGTDAGSLDDLLSGSRE